MIKQLITDIAYDKIKLSQAITRAKLVENKIKNDTLKKWLNKELEGYDYNDPLLPFYRKSISTIYLTAEFPFGNIKTFPFILPEKEFGEKVVDVVNHHRIVEPISMVEQQIESLNQPIGYIQIPPHQLETFAGLYKYKIEPHNGVIVAGKREVGKVHYQNVLEQTKQRLLDILMELENEFPNLIDDYQMNKENDEKVQNIITNNIYGDNNPMNIAAGKIVEQSGNTINITAPNYNELKDLGVEDTQIEELKTIVVDAAKDKSKLAGKVVKWISSVSASLTAKALSENIPAIIEFVHKMFA